MSKPSAKKAARQKRKQQERTRKQRNRQEVHPPITASPSFPAERLGVPTALYGWIGRKVSTIFRLHR